MVQIPFSAAAAAVLVGAVIVGGAIGVMTSPSDKAPVVQASAEPAPETPTVTPSQSEAAEPLPTPRIEQTIVETAPPTPSPPPPAPQITTSETETTTIVTAPVVVSGWGFTSGCVGCIEHRDEPKAHPSPARTERQNPPHEAPAHREVAQHPRFVRPARVAVVTGHGR